MVGTVKEAWILCLQSTNNCNLSHVMVMVEGFCIFDVRPRSVVLLGRRPTNLAGTTFDKEQTMAKLGEAARDGRALQRRGRSFPRRRSVFAAGRESSFEEQYSAPHAIPPGSRNPIRSRILE